MRLVTVGIFLCVLVGVGYLATLSQASGTEWIFTPPSFVSSADVKAPGSLRLLMTGDVMLARDVERKMDHYGHAYPYQHVAELLSEHEYVLGNFEASVPAEHRPTPDMTFAFSVRQEILQSLADTGFTHLSLANNHSYDHGREGYRHSSERIAELGLIPFGDPYRLGEGSVATIESEEGAVALIGLDLTVSDYDPAALEELFSRARSMSDLQIVYVHWGTEYRPRHSAEQERWARYFVAAGADLIVGHHPHVVQDVGEIDGVPVFYSLGNFIFDQYFSEEVQEGLLLSVDLTQRRIELIPVTSLLTPIAPQQMTADGTEQFLVDLAEISDREMKGSVSDGVVRF